jgi:hypothetical protein
MPDSYGEAYEEEGRDYDLSFDVDEYDEELGQYADFPDWWEDDMPGDWLELYGDSDDYGVYEIELSVSYGGDET